MRETKMLTSEEVAEDFGCSLRHLTVLKELGVLNPITIGKGFRYPQKEIMRFQEEYLGLDVSNRYAAMKAKEMVENKKMILLEQDQERGL